jgi:hypothetical protein
MMWALTKKILRDQRGFFRTSGYTPPPAEPPPTEENEETRRAAEEAAAKEKELLKKKRRPTLLTGAAGVTGEPSLYKPQLTGSQTGKTTLG